MLILYTDPNMDVNGRKVGNLGRAETHFLSSQKTQNEESQMQ